MTSHLPVEEVLEARGPVKNGEVLGHSRDGREMVGYQLGHGPCRVSLIAGCHADEPVGPKLLRRLVAYLSNLREDATELTRWTWAIVPDANPDGAIRNAPWINTTVELTDSQHRKDEGYDLASYFLGCVRELPGADVEFGFPRDASDRKARSENLAIASFLDRAGPVHLHISFHGMGFAAGPWFLLERAWVDRTEKMRRHLVQRVHEMGYRLHDVDRKGEKGFHRIAEGFTTRPDSRAMIRHFLEHGDESTAALFRPSSMEYVRKPKQDPLTLVSEMPLFLIPPEEERMEEGPPMPTDTKSRLELFAWDRSLIEDEAETRFREEAQRAGIRAMPISDQMRLQLAFLVQGLEAVATDGAEDF